MALIDDVVTIPGLRRAWPADESISVEIVDERGRIRAGRVGQSGLVLSLYACDPVLGTLPVGEGTLVVHRLARRAVVIGEDRVTKHVRKGGERIARATVTAGRAYRSWGLETASITSWTRSSVTFTRLPGRCLADIGDAGLPGWRLLADSWRPVSEADLARHSGAHEARNLARWAQHARRFDTVQAGPCLAEAVLETSRRLVEPADAAPVVSHTDLHDGQLLWDGTTLGVIDLDGARLAEAALDLTNLRAHAELARLRGSLSARGLDSIIGWLDDAARRMPTSHARLNAYLDAARLRLIFVHSFRPGSRAWLDDWRDHALGGLANTP